MKEYGLIRKSNPELYKEWSDRNEKSLDEFMPASNKKGWWICPLGHEYETKIVYRTRSGSGCPYCAHQKVLVGFNDLQSQYPDIALEWDFENNEDSPTEVSCHSNKKRWWKCKNGHGWKTSVRERTKEAKGCAYCKGKKAIPGETDLVTRAPEIIKEWDYEKNTKRPSEYMLFSRAKVWWKCEKGHEWQAQILNRTNNHTGCPQCSSSGTSRQEIELTKLVSSWFPEGTHIVHNDKTVLDGKELDIYIPSKNIAIEYNGIYWHTENQGKDKKYHHWKWQQCKNQGVQLITVWSDDWVNRRDIVISMLKHKLGVDNSPVIYARKTHVTELATAEVKEFCNKHHIQGASYGSLYLGLRDNKTQELVAASVWRRQGKQLYLDRYCTSATVVGGMGRLLKYAKKWASEQGCEEIITFSNHEVSDGNLYSKLGFTLDKELAPDYSYIYDDERKHKFGFRLKRFREDSNLKYEEGLTESQLAKLNDIPRIWDCGKTRWVIKV